MNTNNPYRQQIRVLDDISDISPYAKCAVSILRDEMELDSAHDESHIVRVVRNAMWFGEAGDFDVIVPAAVLHDLVNVPKSSIQRSKASVMSANKACALMAKSCGFKDFEQGLLIHHAIEAHSFSANVPPMSLEARAVQDADRIESLGYIGVARMFAVGGSMGRTLFHPLDPLAKHRKLDEYRYTLDHYFVKLNKLSGTMQTERGVEEADLLTLKMENFIKGLIDEI